MVASYRVRRYICAILSLYPSYRYAENRKNCGESSIDDLLAISRECLYPRVYNFFSIEKGKQGKKISCSAQSSDVSES